MRLNTYKRKLMEIAHKYGIWRQDILSLFYGLRPCIRFGTNAKGSKIMVPLFSELGLKALVYPCEIDKNYKTIIVLVGKNENLLKKMRTLDIENHKIEMGELLGYPLCCRENWKVVYSLRNKEFLRFLSRDKPSCPVSFKMNFLLNLDTRLVNRSLISRLIQKKFLGLGKYLIPHIPCSLECKQTKTYADNLFEVLKKHYPSFAVQLEFMLKRPVLYFNEAAVMFFDGVVDGASLKYKTAVDLRSLVGTKVSENVRQGDEIVLTDDAMSVFKERRLIFKSLQPPLLFDFSK